MFYLTNVEEKSSKIYVFGYNEDNEKIIKEIPYKQELFIPTRKKSKYKSIYGHNLRRKEFTNRKDYLDYIQHRKDNDLEFYGDIPAPVQVYYRYYKKYGVHEDLFKKLELKNKILSKMRFFWFDIESAYGDSYVKFKDLEKSTAKINALTFFDTKTKTLCTLGVSRFNQESKDRMYEVFKDEIDRVEYIYCKDEKSLLKKWVKFIRKAKIDGLIAYNGDGFDNPYIAWRMKQNKMNINTLSPIKKSTYRSKEVLDDKNRLKKIEYSLYIYGILTIDYWKLYKALTYQNYASNSLNAVAEREIGEGKVNYIDQETDTGETIFDLNALADNNWELFIKYNMKDVVLMKMIDDKIGLLDNSWLLSMVLSCPYPYIFSTIKFYDALIYSELRNRNIIIDGKRIKKARKYIGGYVRNDETEGLIPNLYGWHSSYDVDSEYPTLIVSANISPETRLIWTDKNKEEYKELYEYWLEMIEKYDLPIKEITKEKYTNDNEKRVLKFMVYPNEDYPKFVKLLKKYDLTYTPNGKFFKRDKEGFLPKIMREKFDFRLHLKKLLKENFDVQIKRLEQNVKIVLNSGYGYFGNQYSRYCDVDNIAEAVTSFGRIEIQRIAFDISNAIWKKYGKYYQKDGIDINHVVSYSDTDSVYVNIDPIVKQIIKKHQKDYDEMEIHDFTEKYILPFTDVKLQKVIDKSLRRLFHDCNGLNDYFGMKREVVADKCVFVGAKHYAMRMLFKDNKRCERKNELKINGLDIIKSTTPSVLREHLTEFLRYILNSEYDKLKKDMREVKKMVLGDIDIDSIAKISTISSPMDNYIGDDGLPIKGTPQHIKASIYYNRFIDEQNISLDEINNDDKVKILYLRTPNPLGQEIDAIAYKNEYPKYKEFKALEKYVDRTRMFKVLVEKNVTNITDKIGVQINLHKKDLF